jgi:hypothetical protein
MAAFSSVWKLKEFQVRMASLEPRLKSTNCGLGAWKSFFILDYGFNKPGIRTFIKKAVLRTSINLPALVAYTFAGILNPSSTFQKPDLKAVGKVRTAMARIA